MTHHSPPDHPRSLLRSPRRAVAAGCAVWCALLAGCRGLDATAWKEPPLDERLAHLHPTPYEDRGPVGRMIDRIAGKEPPPVHDPLRDAAGQRELEQARKLYDDGRYAEAEKEFKRIAKRYKHSPAREDALFLIAESRFAQKRYSWAQDSYDELLNEFPSTRHMDAATRRLYEIARTWLGFPEMVAAGDIQPVNFENPRLTPPPAASGEASSLDPTRAVPILPNFHDRRRPIFDTNGRALEALKSIWLKDPTGPLADDALMLAASHYLRQKDYTEADHHYTMLREQFPKSPHLETAFLIGGHVKLVKYQGASYDGQSLAESESLKRGLLRNFPDVAERERVEAELVKIEGAKAEREWEMVRYYQRKNYPKAVAIHCHEILDKYPQTEYAQRAREALRTIDRSDNALLGLPLRYTEPPELLPVPRPEAGDDGGHPS
ncbi:MAG: outer membrane protein assembly factor BamD [Planctomycetales bacterium]